MKKIHYLFLCSCLIAFGCTKSGHAPSSRPIVLTATSDSQDTEAGPTRVSIDEATAKTCTWSENDQISVLTSSGTFKPFSLTNGAGEKTGTFSASLAEDETVSDYAVSPAGNHSFNDGILKVNLPSSYSFIHGVSNIPMVSTVDETLRLSFKHCGGVIRFGIKNVTIKGDFVFKCNTHRITGDFDVDFSTGNPIITAEKDANGSTVTISFDKPESNENLYYFYIPVPVGSYTDFSIEIRDENGETLMTKSAANDKNVVERGTVLKMRTLVQPEFTGGNE